MSSDSKRPGKALSDADLIATLASLMGEFVKRELGMRISGKISPSTVIESPAPFSRADSKSYLRLVELWNVYRTTTQLDLQERPCPACLETDSTDLFESYDGYGFVECTNCRTWYVPQAADHDQIETFLSSVPEARRLSDTMMTSREATTRDTDRQRFEQYFRMLEPLIEGGGRPRYLDIGCGVGHSLELASEHGWDACGIEISEVAVNAAQSKGRQVVTPSNWNGDGLFQVVSLFESLEHMVDPDPVLADAAKNLDKNGVLMVTVPNVTCFEIALMRERCFHVFGGSENVGHINLFNPSSLATLLARHGLTVMHMDGQYSSDLTQVFSHVAGDRRSVLEVFDEGTTSISVPDSVAVIVNNWGPSVAALERALNRSPIMIALACRTEDQPNVEKHFAKMQQNWSGEMLRELDKLSAT